MYSLPVLQIHKHTHGSGKATWNETTQRESEWEKNNKNQEKECMFTLAVNNNNNYIMSYGLTITMNVYA